MHPVVEEQLKIDRAAAHRDRVLRANAEAMLDALVGTTPQERYELARTIYKQLEEST